MRSMDRSPRTVPRLLPFAFAVLLLVAGFGCDEDNGYKPPPQPTVTITTPVAGDTCSGAVSFNAETSNATQVTFYANSVTLGVDETDPFGLPWNTSIFDDGDYTLIAEAGGAGGTARDSIEVSVKNTEPPPEPTVTLTAPTADQLCFDNVLCTAEAENATMVSFYADTALIGSDTVPPYEVDWDTWTTENGSRTIKAEAVGPGGIAEDTAIVTVENISIALMPDTAYVPLGHTQQFRAIVIGVADTSVTWSVDPSKDHGTITQDGIFTAPEEMPNNPTVRVRAVSVARPEMIATAPVILLSYIRVEAETYASGGTYGNIGGRGIYPPASCSYASGGLGVDGLDLDGEWIMTSFELRSGLSFNTTLQSARSNGETRTYEIVYTSLSSKTTVWTDTLVTIPGSGCC